MLASEDMLATLLGDPGPGPATEDAAVGAVGSHHDTPISVGHMLCNAGAGGCAVVLVPGGCGFVQPDLRSLHACAWAAWAVCRLQGWGVARMKLRPALADSTTKPGSSVSAQPRTRCWGATFGAGNTYAYGRMYARR